jgi:hypothetical protein
MGKCIKIPNGFLTLAGTEFKCPYCLKQYNDVDGKYLQKCDSNKSNCTSVKCECNKKFYITYDMTGDVRTFKK